MHEYCTFMAKSQLNFKIAFFSFALKFSHECTNIAHSWLTSKLNFRIAFFSFAIKFSHECTNIAHSWLNLNSISRSRFPLLH